MTTKTRHAFRRFQRTKMALVANVGPHAVSGFLIAHGSTERHPRCVFCSHGCWWRKFNSFNSKSSVFPCRGLYRALLVKHLDWQSFVQWCFSVFRFFFKDPLAVHVLEDLYVFGLVPFLRERVNEKDWVTPLGTSSTLTQRLQGELSVAFSCIPERSPRCEQTWLTKLSPKGKKG